MKFTCVVVLFLASVGQVNGQDALTLTLAPRNLSEALAALDAAPRTLRHVCAEDPSGQVACHDRMTVADGVIQQVHAYLRYDQMLYCDAYGSCWVETVPLTTEELRVYQGTPGHEVSVRFTLNASWPGGKVLFLDDIYGRAFVAPTASSERWYRSLDFGRSLGSLDEVSITRGQYNCNSLVVTGQAPWPQRIDMQADNSTCTSDGQPIVIRFLASVRENDIASCVAPVGADCVARAPVTVLTQKRKGYQEFYGDDVSRIYQHWLILGEPLP